jgi:nicotinamide mononucleotide adenylyltransferase
MARRDPILDMVEKRVKEDSMETRLWAQRLEDLPKSCAVKDMVKEVMTSIN